ncbi:aldo-keto reductase [Salpingoeca rosetta]|uniref:Aldo-keto reductase n=1 Tax=Salpingoeca rosetta (strain ATCC 50818 / BSB-021) TaxID=946362 RepID=F2U252_SALR5|nr:aldo-keto reductase [Salpingoeca rosetta]EGD81704.1 aldo-keto reductase [Salpingoeca rosetta]|eukprot:XP_004996908.1 aldo-keto reductase [Salpingoeca rosetta]
MSTRMTAAPPPLAFGTFKLRGDELRQALHTALAVGYRHIDTATCYRNEEVVGEVLQDEIGSGRLTREDVFITSKLAPKEQGYEQARAAVLGSLERLQLEYIDLYLIHWPGVAGLRREDPGNQEPRRHSWRALEELQGEGKVRHIGVSNYTVRHLQELLQRCHVPPFLNQVECHPLCQQRELRDYCHQHNILLECDPARIKANFQVPPTLTEDELEQLDALDQNHHLCWDPTLVP